MFHPQIYSPSPIPLKRNLIFKLFYNIFLKIGTPYCTFVIFYIIRSWGQTPDKYILAVCASEEDISINEFKKATPAEGVAFY
jgi:hypothetical protein